MSRHCSTQCRHRENTALYSSDRSPIANLLLGFRTRPIVRYVEQELLRRRVPEWTVWGDDLQKALFAQSICELAMLEMGWPNDRFVPSDPAAIVFWNHRDTLDFSAVIRDLEDNLGMKITAADTDLWYGLTIGELVDNLWERHNRTQGGRRHRLSSGLAPVASDR